MGESADSERGGISEAEMLGRLMTVETVLMTLMAHVATLAPAPAGFTAQVMENAEKVISKTAEEAPPGREAAANAMLESFGRLCDQMIAHVHRHTPPQGQG